MSSPSLDSPSLNTHCDLAQVTGTRTRAACPTWRSGPSPTHATSARSGRRSGACARRLAADASRHHSSVGPTMPASKQQHEHTKRANTTPLVESGIHRLSRFHSSNNSTSTHNSQVDPHTHGGMAPTHELTALGLAVHKHMHLALTPITTVQWHPEANLFDYNPDDDRARLARRRRRQAEEEHGDRAGLPLRRSPGQRRP